jgi:ATP-dependent DNA helicase RecG
VASKPGRPENPDIEEAEKYILKNIRIGMKLQGLTRVDVPEIDPEAFREAIINAFCHRDYRDPDEVRIAIFPDRVEVRNPGRLMEGVTLRTLKTAKVSRRRNPLIADLLRRIHLIEAWGRGIPLILEKAPHARFSEVAGLFITEFPRPSAAEDSAKKSQPRPESTAQVTAPVTGQVTARPESRPESNVAMFIIRALVETPMGKIEIARAIGHQTVSGELKKQVSRLLAEGFLERTIPDKPNSRLQKYRLTDKGRTLLGNSE